MLSRPQRAFGWAEVSVVLSGGYTVYFIVSTRYRLHLIARDLQKTRALESRGLAGTWDLSPSQGLGLGWDLDLSLPLTPKRFLITNVIFARTFETVSDSGDFFSSR